MQAPREWIEKFRGKFDAGWDVYRKAAFARQKKLGMVPRDAKLAPMPEGTRTWNSLSPDERRVAARYMEAYAAMLAYCDAQVGRLLATLESTGELDNTLVVFIQGDNGASGEGGAAGEFNYSAKMNGGAKPVITADLAEHLDRIGGPDSQPIGPVGWAAALNTPFPYYKVVASRLGGVRNGVVISWPERLKARGVRSQFVHVTDVMPTVLEATGVKAPDALGGVAQTPFDGISFAYSFTQPDAPARHRTQYFEMFGNAAIYHDGWLLAERVRTVPSYQAAFPDPASPWQLYDLNRDWTQTTDLAQRNPGKVAELEAIWKSEATRNHVLPLLYSNLASMLPGTRPEPLATEGRHVLYPVSQRLAEGAFPAITNRSWSMTAEVEVSPGGGEGMIVSQGGVFTGWGLGLFRGRPGFIYRVGHRDSDLVRIDGSLPLTAGQHTVGVAFTIDGPGFGKGGALVMSVDGQPVATGRLEGTAMFKFSAEDAVIGRDSGIPLVADYDLPFAFTGTIDRIVFDLGKVEPPTAPGH